MAGHKVCLGRPGPRAGRGPPAGPGQPEPLAASGRSNLKLEMSYDKLREPMISPKSGSPSHWQYNASIIPLSYTLQVQVLRLYTLRYTTHTT